MIQAPWTDEQVAALNGYQRAGVMHPFTCGYRDDHYAVDPGILVAKPSGWFCPYKGCDYEQTWAHGFMALPHWANCPGGIEHHQNCHGGFGLE
jgi:hypothetical protein